MQADLWVAVIFAVETDYPHCTLGIIGDDGRALGPGQMHPPFFWEFAPPPKLGETWEQWFVETALAFLADPRWRGDDSEQLAIRYHLGHYPIGAGEAVDAAKYLMKFRRAAKEVALRK